MECPKCHSECAPGFDFCPNCAAPLQLTCAQCGFRAPASFKFCPKCASALAASTVAAECDTQAMLSHVIQRWIPKELAERLRAIPPLQRVNLEEFARKVESVRPRTRVLVSEALPVYDLCAETMEMNRASICGGCASSCTGGSSPAGCGDASPKRWPDSTPSEANRP